MSSSLPQLPFIRASFASVVRWLSVPMLLVLLVGGQAVQAQMPTVSAIRAHEKASAGDWYLIDIRTEGEWRSGTAANSHKISMHVPGLLQKLTALTKGDKTSEIALICATGGRSNWLQSQLRANGWTKVYNVAEGMKGSSAGPGWLKRGLPLAPKN